MMVNSAARRRLGRLLPVPALLLVVAGCVSEPAAPAAPVVAPPAATEAPRITLKWSTATEVDNYGFFVHRGDAEEGPFTIRNERILPGAGNSEVPSSYTWVDEEVVPGKAYFYWLESVSTAGVKEKFSPVIRQVCCKNLPGPATAAATPAAPPAR